jgi:hypothetical protein
MHTPAERIIQVFGGTRRAATALGQPPSTVQSWKRAGVIPARHQGRVLETAQQLNLPITAESFFAEARQE